MKSEERFAIVMLALTLLWGTLITEPFRYFTDFFYEVLSRILKHFNIISNGKIGTAIIIVVICAVAVGLLNLTKTPAGKYIPCCFSCLCLGVFLVRCLIDMKVDKIEAAILMIAVLITMLLLVLKKDRINLWYTDCYCISLPVFLLFGLILEPISRISEKASKVMIICANSNNNFSGCYNRLLTVPGLVWSTFFFLLLMFPIVYFSFYRKEG